MVDIKEIQLQVDEMSKTFGEPGLAEDLKTDPPETNAPGTTAPATSAPPTEAPATKAPATAAPATEAPAEDPRDKEIRDLREKLALGETKHEPKPTKAPPTKAPSTEAPISDEDFLGETDLDDLTRDPKLFNQVLNKIYKKAREDARSDFRKSDELIIRSMPDIVKNNIALISKLKEVNEKFYNDNKDLVPFKKVVGAVFEELISASPNKSYEELLPEVSKTTRERLELHKAANRGPNDKDDKGNPPNLPRKKGSPRQTTKPDTTPLLGELDEMDKVLQY
uniref:Uncharacterized protein n=1 Tax=viral metagenome TaxID=1070528 RepID=A0A6H1ZBY4_9ZZZZ